MIKVERLTSTWRPSNDTGTWPWPPMKKGFLSAKTPKAAKANGYSHSTPGSENPQTAKLLAHCSTLLAARQTSAALRLVQSLPPSDAVNALQKRCVQADRTAKQRAAEALDKTLSGTGPVEAFLALFCAGIEGSDGAWAKINEALEKSLGKFGTMLLDVGALRSTSLLLHRCEPRCEVLLFRGNGPAEWHELPSALAVDESEVTLLSPDATRIEAEMWPAICDGDWLEVGPCAPQQQALQGPWPAIRCAPELLAGALPQSSWEEAMIPTGPALVKDAKLLQNAQHRWSLDFFLDTVPSAGEASEASLFSVYRAPEPRRNFRYAGAGDEDVGYSLEAEDCAERLLMDFPEFVRKRAGGG